MQGQIPLDAHQKPPDALRALFKRYQKATADALHHDASVVDMTHPGHAARFRAVDSGLSASDVSRACAAYLGHDGPATAPDSGQVVAWESTDLPGLVVLPAFVPADVQRAMLDRSLHRDLAQPQHLTNVHFHHTLDYPPPNGSFFDYPPAATHYITPKDPGTHKPMSIQQFVTKKLRWLTLGGQYDWTVKQYPDQPPPRFPPDLQTLLHALFPQTQPEAAIVNVYSPGDVLSLHRDVSEACDNGLISLSIGCDAIFLVSSGMDDSAQRPLALRLRSGDVVYMTGPSRFAWHGVPQIIRGTCPDSLSAWPAPANGSVADGGADTKDYSEWRHWLATKRININVRQMFS